MVQVIDTMKQLDSRAGSMTDFTLSRRYSRDPFASGSKEDRRSNSPKESGASGGIFRFIVLILTYTR